MNFIYFSPHFPTYNWKFCHHLRQNGVNVLGIGDAPYDYLQPELRNSLTEYYKVDDLSNYDACYRACGYFAHRYGRIDRLESHNEHWLVSDARLRTDFNIWGTKYPNVLDHKQKSVMKRYFEKAGVEVPRWCLPGDAEVATAFAKKVGYPVVVKPDSGVGASDTHIFYDEISLASFFRNRPFGISYIMEEFVDAPVVTFDGITDVTGKIVYTASHSYDGSVMDIVNSDYHLSYRFCPKIDPEVEAAGRRVVEAYGLKEAFFHFEFFLKFEPNGKKRVVALEVNLRPPGGLITEVIGYATEGSVYKAWADTVAQGKMTENLPPKFHVAYVSRKNRLNYRNSQEDVIRELGENLVFHYEIEAIFAQAMGNHAYIVRSANEEDLNGMIAYIHDHY